MRVIDQQFRKDGFDYRQVLRDGRHAIYRQTRAGTAIEAYEVVIIREMPERAFMGKILPAAEQYPRSEDWGTRGWTCQTKEEALAKFRELTEPSQDSEPVP